MTGWTIFGIALLLLCAVGEFLYIIWKLETEQVTPEREVPTHVIPADWDRIMAMTTLKKEDENK